MAEAIGQKGFGFLEDIKPDKINLRGRFLVPPFTLLDTRAGYWRERKAEWLALGLKSEIGRGDGANSNASKLGMGMCDRLAPRAGRAPTAKAYSLNDGMQKKYDYLPDIATGTSIFDPVLCELVYRWFCPVNGNVLDPFAGGSVRGIVAGMMKLSYTGFDLSARQIEANEEQKKTILGDASVWWINEDARNIAASVKGLGFDFILSCPPYFDLEVYTDNPQDLSQAKTYEHFLDAYMQIISGCVGRLKANRFACFVVGNIRDKEGFYHNLVGDTVVAFEAAGAHLYNDAVLMNAVGSLPIRITKQFNSGRKMGKCHQNVLVFYKGDPKNIKTDFAGDVVMEWAE